MLRRLLDKILPDRTWEMSERQAIWMERLEIPAGLIILAVVVAAICWAVR